MGDGGLSAETSLTPNNNIYSVVVRKLIENIAPEFKFTDFSRNITIKLYEAYSCDNPQLRSLLTIASSMVDEVFRSASRMFDVALLINMEAVTRIVVHTRSPFMPLEIGVAWHPYLNLPYIPSTALKGVLRAYIEESKAAICDLGIVRLLGSTSEVSGIFVSDALPVGCSKTLIEPDVLTPHYSEARADTEYGISEVQARPIPIVFPTIAPGTKLKFVIAVDDMHTTQIDRQKATCLAKELPGIVERAFEYGIGAKTSVGYGAVKISLAGHALRGEVA